MNAIKLFGDDCRSKKFVDVIAKQPSDCFLYVESKIIKVHKTVLAASSPYFDVNFLNFHGNLNYTSFF